MIETAKPPSWYLRGGGERPNPTPPTRPARALLASPSPPALGGVNRAWCTLGRQAGRLPAGALMHTALGSPQALRVSFATPILSIRPFEAMKRFAQGAFMPWVLQSGGVLTIRLSWRRQSRGATGAMQVDASPHAPGTGRNGDGMSEPGLVSSQWGREWGRHLGWARSPSARRLHVKGYSPS
jgi:hypothetical protein